MKQKLKRARRSKFMPLADMMEQSGVGVFLIFMTYYYKHKYFFKSYGTFANK